jgi:hypothetical protein
LKKIKSQGAAQFFARKRERRRQPLVLLSVHGLGSLPGPKEDVKSPDYRGLAPPSDFVYNRRAMKVTGYMLREAIKQQELRSESAMSRFPNTLKKFPGEECELPTDVANELLFAESALAKLRTAQARYNLMVILNDGITLAEAIKQTVAIGKVEKLWKDLATKKKDRYSMDSDERSPDVLRAIPMVTNKQCVDLARAAAKSVNQIRQRIAIANAKEVEIENLDPTLFE